MKSLNVESGLIMSETVKALQELERSGVNIPMGQMLQGPGSSGCGLGMRGACTPPAGVGCAGGVDCGAIPGPGTRINMTPHRGMPEMAGFPGGGCNCYSGSSQTDVLSFADAVSQLPYVPGKATDMLMNPGMQQAGVCPGSCGSRFPNGAPAGMAHAMPGCVPNSMPIGALSGGMPGGKPSGMPTMPNGMPGNMPCTMPSSLPGATLPGYGGRPGCRATDARDTSPVARHGGAGMQRGGDGEEGLITAAQAVAALDHIQLPSPPEGLQQALQQGFGAGDPCSAAGGGRMGTGPCVGGLCSGGCGGCGCGMSPVPAMRGAPGAGGFGDMPGMPGMMSPRLAGLSSPMPGGMPVGGLAGTHSFPGVAGMPAMSHPACGGCGNLPFGCCGSMPGQFPPHLAGRSAM